MQITEKYYETWIKANDAQLSVNYARVGIVDSIGTSDTATTYARTYGHLVSLNLGVYNTNSIANGGVIYQGNLMNLAPSAGASIVGSYNGKLVYGHIASSGLLAIYNTTGATLTSSSSYPVILYGTYIYQ